MSQVTFSVPDEISLALKRRRKSCENYPHCAAVKLYENGQLSSGAAAELADAPKSLFLSRWADYRVNTFDFSEEDLIHDRQSA